MNKDYFKLGEEIEKKIYNYDDQGNEYCKTIKGKVFQITNHFVVIDNGFYKEAFKYSEFQPDTPFETNEAPYDLSLESYSQDIIKECIEKLNKNQKGTVFNLNQLNQVINLYFEDKDYIVEEDSNIFYIRKK